jgi:hypothetical protein
MREGRSEVEDGQGAVGEMGFVTETADQSIVSNSPHKFRSPPIQMPVQLRITQL